MERRYSKILDFRENVFRHSLWRKQCQSPTPETLLSGINDRTLTWKEEVMESRYSKFLDFSDSEISEFGENDLGHSLQSSPSKPM